MTNPILAGQTPPVQTGTLWNWDKTTFSTPMVTGFPQASGYAATKTGLTPTDLAGFVGIPLQYYGTPPVPVPPTTIQGWIRSAEDVVEQETSILLCQTWVASPPTLTLPITNQCGLLTRDGYQQRGVDYDLEDAAYDFMFKNAQDEAWMAQTLRYRPVQSLSYSPTGFTAIKNVAMVYPLLNTFFLIPPTWYVEDRDFGYVRFVPAANVQMLPLFAMQLSFMGFAENVPGALWFQYTAGLTPVDYQSRFSFMKELVLCQAAITALIAIQTSVNFGAESVETTVDGLSQGMKWGKKGAFGGAIDQFTARRDYFMKMAKDKVSGPMMTFI